MQFSGVEALTGKTRACGTICLTRVLLSPRSFRASRMASSRQFYARTAHGYTMPNCSATGGLHSHQFQDIHRLFSYPGTATIGPWGIRSEISPARVKPELALIVSLRPARRHPQNGQTSATLWNQKCDSWAKIHLS